MTEVTLKANIFIDICSIPSKFHVCMHDRMKNIYAQNQSSIHCSISYFNNPRMTEIPLTVQ